MLARAQTKVLASIRKSFKRLNFSLATRNGLVYHDDVTATDVAEESKMLEHIANNLSAVTDNQIILALCSAYELNDKRLVVQEFQGSAIRISLPTIVSVWITPDSARVER